MMNDKTATEIIFEKNKEARDNKIENLSEADCKALLKMVSKLLNGEHHTAIDDI